MADSSSGLTGPSVPKSATPSSSDVDNVLLKSMEPPACQDPRELLLVLGSPGRQALLSAVANITEYMRGQLNDGSNGKTTPGSPGSVRSAAVDAFDAWRDGALKKITQVLEQKSNDAAIRALRSKRQESILPKGQPQPPSPQDNLVSIADNEPAAGTNEAKVKDPADDMAILQALYRPFPTSLSSLALSDRISIVSSMLLILLSTGVYSAYSRTFLLHLASSLSLPLSALLHEETATATTLIEASSKSSGSMSADAEAEKRKQQDQTSRMWKVGLASVAGAAVIGITGGLAAPVVAGALGGILGGVGLGGVASFLGVFWMNGALVGTLFGAYGAKMMGERVDRYAREVEGFSFVPLAKPTAETSRRLRLTIGINGWLESEEDFIHPWKPLLSSSAEIYALQYESSALVSLGSSLRQFVSSYAWSSVRNEILKRTVLATVWGAFWPAAMLSGAASIVDNPFAHALNRSTKAGKILADALQARVQGERPVTLVGFSLGAALVCACLEELGRRKAFGIVESVVLVGTPAGASREYWDGLSAAVSGRVFNVFSDKDYILGFLYRTHGLKLGIAGLQPIEGVAGIENLNLSDEVDGHLRYPELMPRILTRCGFPNVTGGQEPIEKDEMPSEDSAELPGPGGDFESQPPKRPEPRRSSTETSRSASRIARNSVGASSPGRPVPLSPGSEKSILGLGRISLDGKPVQTLEPKGE